MVNENKKNMLVAVAGAVVGAGAVIASAIALKDKSNQKKVDEVIAKAKKALKGYGEEADDQVEKGKESVKKLANQAIKSAEQATKVAKKGVKKL